MEFDFHLLKIANKAAFLSERLQYEPNGEYFDYLKDDEFEKIKAQWKENLEDLKKSHFSERIKLIAENEYALKTKLFQNIYISLSDCPDWVFSFRKILDFFIAFNELNHKSDFLQEENPIAFEDVLIPIVVYIREELNGYSKHFSANTAVQIEHSILKSLSNLSSLCFFLEAYSISDTESIDYKDFANNFLNTKSSDFRIQFFEEYPVLARLITSEVSNWITFLSQLSNSIDEEIEFLQSTLNLEKSIKIKEVGIGIGDRHNKGKSVVKITFENELSIYFKPRNASLERDFSQFILYVNSILPYSLRLKLPKVHVRNEFAWVENIEFRGDTESNSLKEYYERCGSLLYFAHLFNGTDFHYENLICSGDYPVLIDTETLLQPITRKFKNAPFSNEEGLILNSSVLMTSLLPQWQEKDEHSVYDIGGFTASTCQTGFFEPKWKSVNTSEMELRFEEVVINPQKHKPSQSFNSLFNNQNHLKNGFNKAHQIVTTQRSEILNKIEENQWFQDVHTRIVIRPTKVYSKLIEKLKHPKYLRSGVEYGIELEQFLLNSFETSLTEHEQSKWLDFYSSECSALQEMNIPVFTANTNLLHLFLDGKIIFPNCFLQTGFELLINNLHKRNEDYLKQQNHIIDCSIASRYETNLFEFHVDVNIPNQNIERGYRELANRIGHLLVSTALKSNENKVAFSALKYNAFTKKYGLQILDEKFLTGSLGIAVFFSCLYDSSKDEGFKKAALNCVSNLSKSLEFGDYRSSFHIGFDGIAGIIYGFSKIAHYLKEKKYFTLIEQLIIQISTKKVPETYLDQVFGIAGLIQSIIVYCSLSGNNNHKDLLVQLGDKISERKMNSWNFPLQESPISGFAHGISGIAYSMKKLSNYLCAEKYNRIALKAIEFENATFDFSANGWKDSRELMTTSKDKNLYDWANGAIGAGLVRYTIDPNIFQMDIQITISALSKKIQMNEYNIANGVLGIVDYLLKVGKKEMAENVFNQLLTQLERQEYFIKGFPNEKLGWQPSLFYGLSGFGYQLLRLSDSEKYPSLALFE